MSSATCDSESIVGDLLHELCGHGAGVRDALVASSRDLGCEGLAHAAQAKCHILRCSCRLTEPRANRLVIDVVGTPARDSSDSPRVRLLASQRWTKQAPATEVLRNRIGAGASDDDVLTREITNLGGAGAGPGNGSGNLSPKDLQDRTGARPVVEGSDPSGARQIAEVAYSSVDERFVAVLEQLFQVMPGQERQPASFQQVCDEAMGRASSFADVRDRVGDEPGQMRGVEHDQG